MIEQPDLFSVPTIDQARTERDIALVRVEQAAPDEWKQRAWEWLKGYLEDHAEFFPDDVWAAGLEAPPERRAFGPLVQRAARDGWIVKTDRTRPRTLGHATPAAVWRSTLYREVA